MKKLLASLFVVLLAGCGFNGDTLQTYNQLITENDSLAKYHPTVTLKEEENGDYNYLHFYNVEIDVDEAFDRLPREEQFILMSDTVKRITDKIEEEKQLTDEIILGDVFCGDEHSCNLSTITFSTPENDYQMNITSNKGNHYIKIGDEEYHPEENTLVAESEKVAEDESVKTDVSAQVIEEEPIETDPPSPDMEEGSSNYTVSLADSDGYDWEKMTTNQKKLLTLEALTNMESNGYEITVGYDWFVEALDAFYGDPATNTTSVPEAMAMAGMMGDVFR